MTKPIDVDAFLAQLADDDAVADALMEIDDPVATFLFDLGDDDYTAEILEEFASPSAPKPVPFGEIAALEIELRAMDARETGDWAAFGAGVRESLRNAFGGLAAAAEANETLSALDEWLQGQDGDA